MSFEFEPFDDDDLIDMLGGGLSADDLNLTIPDDLPVDLAAMIACRPRYERREWWTTTEAEDHFIDLPAFNSADDRARWFITQMAREYQRTIGADDHAKMHSYRGEMVSLNHLLTVLADQVATVAMLTK